MLSNFRIVFNDQDRSSAPRRLCGCVVGQARTIARLRRSAARSQRDLDREHRALSVQRANADRMAKQFAQTLDDGQPQAEATTSLAGGVVHLVVFLEYSLQLRLGDADPGVPDLNAQIALSTTAPDEHLAAVGIFQRVRNQGCGSSARGGDDRFEWTVRRKPPATR